MNGKETAKAAREYVAWANTEQAKIEAFIDRSNRAAQDIRAGHRPQCTLKGCHHTCKHGAL